MLTPVAATVPQDPWYAQFKDGFEATDSPNLNTESPSERWDGDCALSQGTRNHFAPVPDNALSLAVLESRRYRGRIASSLSWGAWTLR